MVVGTALATFLSNTNLAQAASKPRLQLPKVVTAKPVDTHHFPIPEVPVKSPAPGQITHPENVAQPNVSASNPYNGLGDLSFYTSITLHLNDRSEIKVNVANGNLLFHSTELHVKGTGVDLGLDSSYNSLPTTNAYTYEHGNNWTFNLCASQYLDLSKPASGITYYGASNFAAYFAHNSDGSYKDAPGLHANLKANGDGTYTLNYYQSKEKITFGSDWSISKIQDKNNNTVSCAYDFSQPKKHSAKITDSQGRVTTITHDEKDHVSAIYDPIGRSVGYTYDDNNNLTAIKDASQKSTTLGYSGSDLTSITDPLNHTTGIEYGSGHKVSSITDAAGHTISFAYNKDTTVVTDQNGHSTTYAYNSSLQVTKTTDALNHSRQNTFDATTYNVSRYSDALSDFSDFQFSPDGNKLLSTSTYDGSKPNGSNNAITTRFSYPSSGNNQYSPLTQTDPQNNETDYAYNSNGNLLSSTDKKSGNKLTYTYNDNGTVATQKDPNGNVTSYEYDDQGNLTSVMQPAPLGKITMSYDGLSRVTRFSDGKGQVTIYTYDDLDHITGITYAESGSQIVYAYDDNGNLLSVDDSGSGVTTFGYDALNRQTQKQTPEGTKITSTFDNVGNLTGYNDGTGVVGYAYDAANRMTTLTEPGGAQSTYGYDNSNRKTSFHYPNGTGMLLTYNSAGQEASNTGGVMSADGKSITTAYTRYNYTYVSGKNSQGALVGSTTELDPVNQSGTEKRNYSYDSQSRLTEAALINTGTNKQVNDFKYQYDANGNLTGKNVAADKLQVTYSYNGANELTTSSQGVTYSYDANGNLTGWTGGPSFSYNSRNQATVIGSNTFGYTGGNQNERTNDNGNAAVYGGLGLTSLTTAAGTTAFVRCSCGLLNSERTPDGKTYYYLFDGLGSIVGMTDSAGKEVNGYDYDPYGNLLNSKEQSGVTNPWKYAGGYLDGSTGLYKYGIRYYDPQVGRWTQRTPVGGSLAETLKANPYVYADNNPVNKVDPSGRYAAGCEFFIPGAILTYIATAWAALGPLAAFLEAFSTGVEITAAISGPAGWSTLLVLGAALLLLGTLEQCAQ